MNRNSLALFLIVLAVLLAAGGAAVAADDQGTFKGQAVAIDVPGRSITVVKDVPDDTPQVQQTFKVDEGTKILRDGSQIGLDEVGTGDIVVVNYTVRKGEMIALTIGVAASS